MTKIDKKSSLGPLDAPYTNDDDDRSMQWALLPTPFQKGYQLDTKESMVANTTRFQDMHDNREFTSDIGNAAEMEKLLDKFNDNNIDLDASNGEESEEDEMEGSALLTELKVTLNDQDVFDGNTCPYRLESTRSINGK